MATTPIDNWQTYTGWNATVDIPHDEAPSTETFADRIKAATDNLRKGDALEKRAKKFKKVAIVSAVLFVISALALASLFVPPIAGITASILGGALLATKFGAIGATALFGLGSLSYAIGSSITARAARKILE